MSVTIIAHKTARCKSFFKIGEFFPETEGKRAAPALLPAGIPGGTRAQRSRPRPRCEKRGRGCFPVLLHGKINKKQLTFLLTYGIR